VEVADAHETLPLALVASKEDNDNWREVVRSQTTHLLPRDQDQLLCTMVDYSNMWDGHLGRIDVHQHRIPTGKANPVARQPYRVSTESRKDIDAELEKMVNAGVIRPSSSPWAAPVVMIRKSDGSWRFAIDYRGLNAVTKKGSMPMPRLDDALDALGNAKWFTTLDANSGFWKVKMAEGDIPKTAFSSHRGLFEFTRMPFGLVAVPATFQRAIDIVLSTVRFECALTYLDDIIIYSSTLLPSSSTSNISLPC
jgi:Reverse transcriptase (RNA-dependent DNA polymerase)